VNIIRLLIVCALTITSGHLYAQVMTSTNYQIETDSINVGGTDFSTSTNYTLSDTVGEVGTGAGTSTNYNLFAGYRQMQEVFIALNEVSDVVMSPNLGGITGGTSNGSTTVTVTTDSLSGYSLTVEASTDPALKDGSNSINDYAPVGGNPDFTFSVATSDAEFGFTPEGTDIATRFKDNTSSCNTGSGDAEDACWDGLSSTPITVSQSTGSNHPSGTNTILKFRTEIGSSKVQSEGTYTATITVTALPQ